MIKQYATFVLYALTMILVLSACSLQHQAPICTSSFALINPITNKTTTITNMVESTTACTLEKKGIVETAAIINAASLNNAADKLRMNKDVIISDAPTGYDVWIYKNGWWVVQTGEKSEPKSALELYGSARPNFIVLKDIYANLWLYNGSKWTKQLNSNGYPLLVDKIYGNPEPDSIIMKDKLSARGLFNRNRGHLWAYDGSKWQQLTGTGLNQPNSVRYIAGLPKHNQILLVDNNTSPQLWKYDGVSWVKLTGGIYQPQRVQNIYGRYPTLQFLVLRDNDNVLWVYNGVAWSKQSNGKGYPPRVDYVYDDPRPDSIVVKDTNSQLWLYNGKLWLKLTGGVNAPQSVDNVGGHPTPQMIVLKDGASRLWLYNGKQFKLLSGNLQQPPSVSEIFGYPTESSIVIEDNSGHNLWVYGNDKWRQETGLPNQPNNLNLKVMVNQRILQE